MSGGFVVLVFNLNPFFVQERWQKPNCLLVGQGMSRQQLYTGNYTYLRFVQNQLFYARPTFGKIHFLPFTVKKLTGEKL